MNFRSAAVGDALTTEHKHFLERRLTFLILLFCGIGSVLLILICLSLQNATGSYGISLKYRLGLNICTTLSGESENQAYESG